jgi:hypothetical protein
MVEEQQRSPSAAPKNSWWQILRSWLIKFLRVGLGYVVFCIRLSPVLASFIRSVTDSTWWEESQSEPLKHRVPRVALVMLAWLCVIILAMIVGISIAVGIIHL